MLDAMLDVLLDALKKKNNLPDLRGCRANQLASGITWGNDGQRQIRSGEDDRRDEPRPRRRKKRCPESEGHRHVCKANTEKEKTCSEKEPSSYAEISQF
jgi:hypothetical protein